MDVYYEIRESVQNDRQEYWDMIHSVVNSGERILPTEARFRGTLQNYISPSELRSRMSSDDRDRNWNLELKWWSFVDGVVLIRGEETKVSLHETSVVETAVRYLKYSVLCEELRNVAVNKRTWRGTYARAQEMDQAESRIRKFRLENASLLEEHGRIDQQLLADWSKEPEKPDPSTIQIIGSCTVILVVVVFILLLVLGAVLNALD